MERRRLLCYAERTRSVSGKQCRNYHADYRLILVLHDMEELSDGDVAEITGLRPGTIRVRLHRARLFVRKELAKQDQHRVRRQTAKPSEEIHLSRTTAPTALQGNVRRTFKLS